MTQTIIPASNILEGQKRYGRNADAATYGASWATHMSCYPAPEPELYIIICPAGVQDHSSYWARKMVLPDLAMLMCDSVLLPPIYEINAVTAKQVKQIDECAFVSDRYCIPSYLNLLSVRDKVALQFFDRVRVL